MKTLHKSDFSDFTDFRPALLEGIPVRNLQRQAYFLHLFHHPRRYPQRWGIIVDRFDFSHKLVDGTTDGNLPRLSSKICDRQVVLKPIVTQYNDSNVMDVLYHCAILAAVVAASELTDLQSSA